jgi:hypothetical protein
MYNKHSTEAGCSAYSLPASASQLYSCQPLEDRIIIIGWLVSLFPFLSRICTQLEHKKFIEIQPIQRGLKNASVMLT